MNMLFVVVTVVVLIKEVEIMGMVVVRSMSVSVNGVGGGDCGGRDGGDSGGGGVV